MARFATVFERCGSGIRYHDDRPVISESLSGFATGDQDGPEIVHIRQGRPGCYEIAEGREIAVAVVILQE